MIVKRKLFGLGNFTGITNLANAAGKGAGANMGGLQKFGQGALGVGKMAAIGGTALAGIGAYKFAKSSKKALKGEQGDDNVEPGKEY